MHACCPAPHDCATLRVSSRRAGSRDRRPAPVRAGATVADVTRREPPYPMRMYFAGVDLAWAGRNPTGVAVARRRRPAGAPRRRSRRRRRPGRAGALRRRATAWSPSTRRWWSPTPPDSGPPRRRSTATSAGSRPARTRPTPPSPSSPTATRGADGRRACGLDMDPRSPAAAARHRGLPASGDRGAVPVGANAEIQGQTGPQPRPAAVAAAAADGRHRKAGARRGAVARRKPRRLDRDCAARSPSRNARAISAAPKIPSTPWSAPTWRCTPSAAPTA